MFYRVMMAGVLVRWYRQGLPWSPRLFVTTFQPSPVMMICHHPVFLRQVAMVMLNALKKWWTVERMVTPATSLLLGSIQLLRYSFLKSNPHCTLQLTLWPMRVVLIVLPVAHLTMTKWQAAKTLPLLAKVGAANVWTQKKWYVREIL